MSEEKYRHLYVVMEIENGKPIPVSLEMLGEARRLMDKFNKKYSSKEKVVAILLGDNVKKVSKTLIQYGADAVIIAENPELKDVRNTIYTKVISQIAQDSKLADQIEEEYAGQIKKPRYMFFGADSIGRHLSSTVLVELDSGLASDINQLIISDLKITHQHKTAGNPITYEKTLEMSRPDFSGFLWTTILCLDNINPNFPRDYFPQACSLIPGVFEPIEPDSSRQEIIKKQVDFDSYKAIVSFGRGIKDDPEKNIKLIEKLAEQLNAGIGVTLPISKKPFSVNQSLESTYMIPDRVIGTSGSRTGPLLYVPVGISGAMQHVWGMQDSRFIVAINPDEEAPIKTECDIFIKGRMEDVIPLLIEELKKEKQVAQA